MQAFEARPEFERDVRSSFARQKLMDLCGASLTKIVPGTVEIQMPSRALTQHHAYLHAAVVTAFIDNASGFAAMTVSLAGTEILTVEYKVNFLASAIGEILIVRGTVRKKGRTFTICTGDAVMVRDGKEQSAAMMVATMHPVAS